MPSDKNRHITTATDKEEEALEWVAGGPDQADAYLDARVHEVLQSYINQYNLATAVVPPADLGQAYIAATAEQQTQIAQILGVPIPEPTT